VQHDSSGNNKDNSVANTSLIRARENNKVPPARKQNIFVLKGIVGRTKTRLLGILVSLWRYSPLVGSTKLSYLIGSVVRLIGLSIASNGWLILRFVAERENLKSNF
jgi:hypothetical protein